MSTSTIRLPESLHAKIKDSAKAKGISINQFLVVAAAEKMSALLTADFLKNEVKQGRQEDFERFLVKVPDSEPEVCDRL